MKSTQTNAELAAAFRELAKSEGEIVWNRQIVRGTKRYSLPFMSTTTLANHLEQGSLLELDPNAWVVESFNQHEWRLYLRVGERYGEGWIQQFVPPVEVGVKSPEEFVLISQLPRDYWWQAEFVCPFCDTLCRGEARCPHLMVSHHSVQEPYRTTTLVSLMAEMREREFNCNMLNADIAGLKIKVPRFFVNGEWFRFAYWYVRSVNVVDQVQQLLTEGKRATRYDD